jgi:hypothetical protein
MKNPHKQEKPRSRVKTRKRTAFSVIVLAIAISAGLFSYLWFTHPDIFKSYKEKLSLSFSNQPPVTERTLSSSQKTSDLSSTPGKQSISPAPQGPSEQSSHPSTDNLTPQNQAAKVNGTAEKAVNSQEHLTQQVSIQELVEELNSFYSHLDRQPYMQEFHLKESSKKHFSKLLQVLLDNPPAITRETDDYFTLLKNTAHFFRVLGKENIVVLKGILDREKESLEKILKTFYILADHSEYLKKEYGLIIPRENLYDYAGFFLNTIGGRLYLFRRDSASRMTVSFYAVQIIDKANRQGNNRLGIDLRPPINSLIEEMENSGNRLKLKEEYLDTLYDLKEIYGNRD